MNTISSTAHSLKFTAMTLLCFTMSACSDFNHSRTKKLADDQTQTSDLGKTITLKDNKGIRNFSLNDFKSLDIGAAESLLRQNGYTVQRQENTFTKKTMLIATYRNRSIFRIPYDKPTGKVQQVNVFLAAKSSISYKSHTQKSSVKTKDEKRLLTRANPDESKLDFSARSNAIIIDMELLSDDLMPETSPIVDDSVVPR